MHGLFSRWQQMQEPSHEKPAVDVSSYPRHYAQKPAARSEASQPQFTGPPTSNLPQPSYGTVPKYGPSIEEYGQWLSGYNGKPGQGAHPQRPHAAPPGSGGLKPESQVSSFGKPTAVLPSGLLQHFGPARIHERLTWWPKLDNQKIWHHVCIVVGVNFASRCRFVNRTCNCAGI